jgi:hypothetical protein
VTVVADFVYREDQSIGLGIYDSYTAWRPSWNEAALHHADSTSLVVFVEKHSPWVLAVRLAKSWPPNFAVPDVQHGDLHLEMNLFLADVNEHEWTRVCQGFVVEDIVADILRQQQWCYRCQTRTRNAYRHTLRRKMTCSQLLLTARNDCSAI